ncbi:DUF2917 domain-containing protein [Paraburkholderia sp.]|uniref:DUF2917 domain-containing protein n=1 Tax=Paraburkholderia sp. TaxID=1926495 RepID=UPI0025CE4434|nr:DUF2917 domain-containing protein [Paraburkholderia sp.]
MHAAKPVTTLNVARGTCRTWRAARGGWLIVRACAWRAWVTVEGDPADYWLAPGEALLLAHGERVRIGGWNEDVCCEWRALDAVPRVPLALLVPSMPSVPLAPLRGTH